MTTAHELFQQHPFQKLQPLLRGMTGSYLFEIEDAGYWFISLRNGAVEVEEKRHDADCTISCNEPDFIDIIEGRRNLITASMQGRVKIRGDVVLAQRFHALVRALHTSRREEAA